MQSLTFSHTKVTLRVIKREPVNYRLVYFLGYYSKCLNVYTLYKTSIKNIIVEIDKPYTSNLKTLCIYS